MKARSTKTKSTAKKVSASKKAAKRTSSRGLTAKDVMTKKVTTIAADASIASLVQQLRATRFSGFPVIDAQGNTCGLISQNDVLRALAAGAGPDFQASKRKASVRLLEGAAAPAHTVLQLEVRDLMTPNVIGCAPSDPIAKVAKLMVSKRVHRVVVLDGKKVAGLVSATDLVKHVAKGA